MNLSIMVLMAIVSTLTMLIAALRVIKWKMLIRYHWAADIFFTLVLLWMFAGTISGMVIAIIAGLIFSITLTVGKVLTPKDNI